MIHFDEAECMLYLDGQLDARRAAELSAHTAVCGDCRALLGALEKESRLLGQALLEQDEPLPIRLREAPWAAPAPASVGAVGMGALVWLAAAAALALWTAVQPWAEQLDQCGISNQQPAEHGLFQRRFLGRMGIYV